MLTARKLEMLNGHATTVIRSADSRVFTAECECDCADAPVKIEATALCELLALERLRDLVLQEHGRIVMERAGWKCENCEAVGPLSADHIVARAHGRDDRVSNLRALDQACHDRRHRENNNPNVHRVDIARQSPL